ncbi:hypothetical protein BpHYR1_027552 [Brachionus plicatilis]|uniref:Uncharacterized protein n=1 Tax=Brachionus plicatilis TaxID=10195 RepID=A0A3M7SP92_BRAPC|nr:hypothetical protein BpHYR1_027552 [Brachionus plicatilis]
MGPILMVNKPSSFLNLFLSHIPPKTFFISSKIYGLPKKSDEIEYVYSNEFSFEYSLLCASQSSIASFQETPTSIHKGTKRKEDKLPSINLWLRENGSLIFNNRLIEKLINDAKQTFDSFMKLLRKNKAFFKGFALNLIS